MEQRLKRLLDQVREAIRPKPRPIRTEQAYVTRINRYILFHDNRHPKEMGGTEKESRMKSRSLVLATTLGIGLTVVVLLLLTRPTPSARADPGTYYVRAGASGDCASPATPCGRVQSAISLANLPGDEVWVTAGTYTENLIITHGVKLRGGWDISFTTQNPAGSPTILDGSGEHGVRIENAPQADVMIQGLTLRNNRDGIHIWTGNVRVERCTVLGASRQGFEIDGGSVLISNTRILTAQQGIEIDAGVVRAIDVHIAHTIEEGLLIEGGGTVTLTGSVIEDCAQQGVQIDQGEVWLLGNSIHDVDADGIRIEGGAVSIISNTVYAVASDGLDVRGSQIISGNLIYDTGKWGIYAHDGALTVIGNTVHDTDDDGIRTADGTVVTVRGNKVSNVGNDGIDVRGAVVSIAHNTVSTCSDNGIRSEGGQSTRVEANRVLQNGTGLAIRGVPVFTITNNIVGDHVAASVELTGTGSGVLYHNTLVGRGTGAQGVGLAVLNPLTLILANNIIVNHNAGISATIGATLIASNSLLWGNGDDPTSSTVALLAPPRFAAPEQHDYHLLPSSPAIDAGAPVGVSKDADGDPRPIGPFPDIGADEFPAAARVTKQATPTVVQPGAPLTYTIHVTNSGIVTLTATITDTPPDGVSPAEPRAWTATLAPGNVWTGTVVVAVESGYAGPLVNVVQVTTEEGATGAYTHTLAPDLAVTKRVHSALVLPGESLTYTICLTNTGNFHLNATITDTLPDHITSGQTRSGTTVFPGEQVAWTAFIPAPGGVWTETVVVTVEMDYAGPLTNVVEVKTDEGATGAFTLTLAPGLAVSKRAHTDRVEAGEQLTYTMYVTNTGNFFLHATITDTLPEHITQGKTPGGTAVMLGGHITWTAEIPTPGGVWSGTVVVTVETEYAGPLTNVVQVTTAEGVSGVATDTSTVVKHYATYLPLLLRDFPPTNLVQNPSFEGIHCRPDSPPGWCLDNWTHDTHDREIHDNIFTPQGWVTWWREGDDYGQPEVKTIPNVPPFTNPLRRIRSGNYAVLLFTFYRNQDTGLYQVVDHLTPGATAQFSAYAHGWSCDSDEPLGYTCGDPWNQTFQVGIEPNGVADPLSPSIVWSPEQTSPDYYSLIGPVTAQVGAEGSVCVYLRSKTRLAYRYQDAYWDDALLTTIHTGNDNQ